MNSECVRRDVRRIPLKPEGENEEEVKHLSMSSDGVRFFHPATLHEHNCQSTAGLLAVVAELDKLYHFTDAKKNTYSVLNIDVSLYNMLMHTAYSFAGMQPYLDRVLCFSVAGIVICMCAALESLSSHVLS